MTSGRCFLSSHAFYFTLTFSLASAQAAHVISLSKSDDFYNNVRVRPQFVLFYTSWCGHCLKIKPIFEKLAESYHGNNNNNKAIFVKVDCDDFKSLCYDLNIVRYPTLQYFWTSQEKSFTFKGKKSFVNLYLFVEKMLKKCDPADKPILVLHPSTSYQSGQFELTSHDFQDTISLSKYNFIQFFVPWCSHCQAMSATWSHLRNDYIDSMLINIAKVDCIKHSGICKDQGIRGYPSLLIFKDGDVISQYYGERDYDSLKNLIKSLISIKESNLNSEEAMGAEIDGEEVFGDEFELNESNFRFEVEHKTHFVLYFNTSRPYHSFVEEEWIELRKIFVHSKALTISRVNCLNQNNLCQEERINTFPSILIYHEGKKIFECKSDKSFSRVKEFIKFFDINFSLKKNNEKSVLMQFISSSIIHLDEEILSSYDGSNLVLFYSLQWNQNFEILFLWVQLTEEWSGNQNGFKITAVNCDINPTLSHLYEIHACPAIIYIKQKRKMEEFSDKNNHKDLTDYIRRIVGYDNVQESHYDTHKSNQHKVELAEKDEL